MSEKRVFDPFVVVLPPAAVSFRITFEKLHGSHTGFQFLKGLPTHLGQKTQFTVGKYFFGVCSVASLFKGM